METDREIREHLVRAWCLTLQEDFRDLVRERPALAGMAPPNLAVSDRLSTTLGHWDEDTRTITLAEALLLEHGLRDVRAVFLHEVAHQVVSEAFGIRRAVAHGEAFRRACGTLGIPARATFSREDLGADGEASGPDAILVRIRKLLALGTSSNPHEAERALGKAHELALRHNIELRDAGSTTDFDVRILAPVYRRVPSWNWSILGILDEYWFTRYICRPLTDADGRRVQVVELYGTRRNLDLAEYVYYFLRNQGDLLWRAFRRSHPEVAGRARLSYLNGLYSGFAETLQKRHADLARSKALVWKGDPRLEAFFRQRNPRVSRRSVSSNIDAGAHEAGKVEGRKLRLRPGIGDDGRGSSAPKLLGG